MKDTSLRTFTITRADSRVPFKFAVHTLTLAHHPQRAHIVYSSTFIGGKSDETAEQLSPEQIAYFLIEADMKAHLELSICHN